MTQRRDERGNIIISSAPNMLRYKPVSKLRFGQQLLLYQTGNGQYFAMLTGNGANEEVTGRLPMEQWADIHSKAIAACAILGHVPAKLDEEIEI